MRKASGSLQEFTDLETWHWHAYDYAFRRVSLDDFGAVSPLDPDGAWFNTRLVEQAEGHFRAKYRKPAKQHFELAPAGQIRENCRLIPSSQLNENEREFLRPGIEAISARAKAKIGAFEARSRAAFRGPRSTRYQAPAREIDPPLQPTSPERLRELDDILARKLGQKLSEPAEAAQ